MEIGGAELATIRRTRGTFDELIEDSINNLSNWLTKLDQSSARGIWQLFRDRDLKSAIA